MSEEKRFGNQDMATKQSLIEMLQYWAEKTPNRLAFQYLINGEEEGPRVTYSELDQSARAIAAELQSQGFARERALLLYSSGLEFISAFFGCLYAQVIAVPAYPPKMNRHLHRLNSIVQDAGASVILTTFSQSQKLLPMLKETDWHDMTMIATDTISQAEADYWEVPAVDQDTLAFLQYTSGSTGAPKGVMVSHGNLLHNMRMFEMSYELNQETPILSWLPLFHDMGLIGKVLLSVYVGAPCYLMAPVDFLQSPKRWLKAISKYRIHYSGGPNFAYDLCVRKTDPKERETLDLSSWKVAMNGAEPVRSQTLMKFTEFFRDSRFHPEAFNPGYGLAEGTLMVSVGNKFDKPIIRTISHTKLKEGQAVDVDQHDSDAHPVVGCGHTWWDQEVIIVDPQTRKKCPNNQVGEIWVKGPSIAKGYWNNNEATEATFEAYTADTEEGPYLRTGDLGFMREQELYITGRMKDVLIVRGQNHYPQDIEFTVENSHPALRPGCTAAFLVPHQEEEKLVVVAEMRRKYWPVPSHQMKTELAQDHHRTWISREEIIDLVREAIAEEHQLHLSELVLIKEQSIPKTSSGKIQRSQCKQDYLNGQLIRWGLES